MIGFRDRLKVPQPRDNWNYLVPSSGWRSRGTTEWKR